MTSATFSRRTPAAAMRREEPRRVALGRVYGGHRRCAPDPGPLLAETRAGSACGQGRASVAGPPIGPVGGRQTRARRGLAVTLQRARRYRQAALPDRALARALVLGATSEHPTEAAVDDLWRLAGGDREALKRALGRL